MSTPRHSEAATNAAKAIVALYLPKADRKQRGQIAAAIDQAFAGYIPPAAAFVLGITETDTSGQLTKSPDGQLRLNVDPDQTGVVDLL